MNLHGIVSGAISAVNPPQSASLYRSAGYTTLPDGRQQPKYAPPATVNAQVQDLSQKDLAQLASMNVQGSQRVAYLNGSLFGLVRVESKGGDLLTMADGHTWLVTAVLEQWADWCKVALTLQDDDAAPFFPSLQFNDARNSQYVPLALRAF